ncbi:SDR family NAD(P)-dependent oxidoreductase [Chitinivibrio alkaliphilus]|uniref:Short-chain dehydrogenase/reductase SDR n=1 Tax=Chitinivibrio alkaliphilus ACht1 TaxID=1313304 RepID=U7D7C9_9BACT|nr:SDR family NAD(P)-dependent oxidoreductase [Chitinivibrio alkaliphilus]ERP38855.1 short-chain dehydrogenase/reductase SDR [Chitinivibrio alkaliphilus ACht1]
MKKAFISGISSGLGLGLGETLTDAGWDVYGISRRNCPRADITHATCDIRKRETIHPTLTTLMKDLKHVDLVILNAGVLGRIADLSETAVSELQDIFNVNVWAQKSILDWFLHHIHSVGHIILISSGAAVVGNRGWGGYALSKAAGNMLIKLYAHEFPQETGLTALAPGLIDTQMTHYLRTDVDRNKYHAVERIAEAHATGVMLSPRKAAERILTQLTALRECPRGEFVDIRSLDAPHEYAKLMGAQGTTTHRDSPAR